MSAALTTVDSSQLATRMDGQLYDAVTSLGTPADPGEQIMFTSANVYFHSQYFDNARRKCTFADKVVGWWPARMTSKWCNFTIGDEGAGEKVEDVQAILNKWKRRYFRGQWEARLNGGCAYLRLVDDGRQPWEPIDWDNIRTVRYSRMLSRWEIYPDLQDWDLTEDPRDPEFYNVASTYNAINGIPVGYKWHRDRVLRFDGVELSQEAYRYTLGWGDSVLLAFLPAALNYLSAIGYASNGLKDFEVLNLASDLLQERQSNSKAMDRMRRRARTLKKCMSVLNVLITSKSNEELNYVTRQFRGVAEIIEKMRQAMVDQSGMTKAQLLGDHPTGNLGSTGESVTQEQAVEIHNHQVLDFEPKLKIDLKLLMAAKDGPTKGKTIDKFDINWVPLFEMTEAEKSQIRSSDAQTLNTYINMGDKLGKPVFVTEEIRQLYAGSRYRNLGEIALNKKAYDAKLKEIEQQKEAENQFDMPPGIGGEPAPPQQQALPAEGAPPEGQLPTEQGQTDSADDLIDLIIGARK